MQRKLFSIAESLVFFFSASMVCADNSHLPKTDSDSVGFSAERLKRLNRFMRALIHP